MSSSERKPVLYSYFRSSASWRVRIALAWKNVDYEYKPVNLLTHANLESDYRQVNPTGKVPAFITAEGEVLAQSQAILEYLEETFPERPMLPNSPVKRAEVREVCQIIACDIHPLQNLGVLQRISGDDMDKKVEWARNTITLGFQGLEKRLEKLSGTYCIGDSVTMADFFLVPMVGNANRWNVDMSQFPLITKINNNLMTLPEFIAASPPKQPDCPEELRK
ncbi:maleylacetoacetate isomerase [Mycotypha africana]|uniref:maleylacetoacetate isomerase n=1 Tax=Mycotypha africana TaxID=64632 RepID=UPI0023006BBB|nr:maleylacetoacetate isomerase [Mycotypha africana]KAI8971570.1 maleylacetoacetate isomerase [Mycotypha africana]